MCNLYKIKSNVEAMREIFRAMEGPSPNLPEELDLYPNRPAPVIRSTATGRELLMMTWGFPPPPNLGNRPVTNVRNLSSPFWRTALSNPERRCLVPVTSFCEYEGEKGAKRKVWFEVTDQPLFAFAGIWRPTEDGSRFAFLTCEPNEIVGPVHPKAMPVVLQVDAHDRWLTDDHASACELAVPYTADRMRVFGAG